MEGFVARASVDESQDEEKIPNWVFKEREQVGDITGEDVDGFREHSVCITGGGVSLNVGAV